MNFRRIFVKIHTKTHLMKDENYKQPLIFVVDDDEDDILFIRNAIEQTLPMSCIKSFIHGRQLIDQLSDIALLPNFILLDLNMPVLSGLDTLKMIRENPVFLNVPVIILSTSNNPYEKALCLKYGANNYYCKPACLSDYDHIAQKLKHEYIDKAALSQYPAFPAS